MKEKGREGEGKIEKEKRRKGEEEKIIEWKEGEIGVKKRIINIEWMGNWIKKGIFGDGVEGKEIKSFEVERIFMKKKLKKMKGNGLKLEIRVGWENEEVDVIKWI